jgi:hypothetical protein
MNLRRLARKAFGPWERRDTPDSVRRGYVKDPTIRWLPYSYVNNRYSVQLSAVRTEQFGEVLHLWIRRHVNKPARSWTDLMRIKDELIGEERVAIEVYPAAEDVVDQAHMTHLWVLGEGVALPFGLKKKKGQRS